MRIPQSFLFGLKRLLVSWGFKGVRVETEDTTLAINGIVICSAKSENNQLKLTWAKAWADWKELHEDKELDDLIKSC
eukprot:10368334-Karenia_brevis.AAC.1